MDPIIDVLIVDDEPEWRERLSELLDDGVKADFALSLDDGLMRIDRRFYYLALIDKRLVPGPGDDEGGMRVLQSLAQLGEGTKGLMFTAYPTSHSAREAILDWDARDYVFKEEFQDQALKKRIREKIRQLLHVSKEEYAKRYGSGFDQLAAEIEDKSEREKWKTEVISLVTPVGQGGGYSTIAHFLGKLLRGIPPLLRIQEAPSITLDKETQTVEGKYWSKGVGGSVTIRFGRKASIESEAQSLDESMIIRKLIEKPYGGLILRADIPFENFRKSDQIIINDLRA